MPDVGSTGSSQADSHYKILLLLKRRRGMSIDEFRDYYENHHVPLVERYATGIARYIRRYLEPHPNPGTDDAAELPYDVVTELWFDDRSLFDGALQYLTTSAMPDEIVADEWCLFDRSTMRIATVVERS